MFGPVGFDGDLAEFSFSEFWFGVGGALEVEEGLLDVGGETGEVEDLRDSGAGDAGGAGDFIPPTPRGIQLPGRVPDIPITYGDIRVG